LDLSQRLPEILPPPAGISESDWEATPPTVRALMDQLITQLETLSARVSLSWKSRSAAAPGTPQSLHPVTAAFLSPQARGVAKPLVASAVASRAIPVRAATASFRAVQGRGSPSSQLLPRLWRASAWG